MITRQLVPSRSKRIRLFQIVIASFSFWFFALGFVSTVSAQAPPITSSGLNTQISGPIAVGGRTQFNITGGIRPGGGTNLFHSFGNFNVPTNNIANFLNDSGLPTSNILGRVTGGNPSSILGMIQTNGPGGFGNANLFLMNPAGFLFGPNATVNVGGMVAFTTADYLRFQGSQTLFNNASTPESLVPLSIAPVAAFGFLGSNPAAIAIQGSTLQVADGQTLSLVGGNRGFMYTDPDTGLTATTAVPDRITIGGGKLLARGGQINIASVASPGEILFPSLQSAPNINGQSFTAMGNISLSPGTLIDVSADAAGTVRIRGGQLVMDNATISANTGEQHGAQIAIDIETTGDMSISATEVSALTAKAMGAGNAGEIRVTSANLNVNLSYPEFGEVIDSSTLGSGNGGKVTLTTGNLTLNNTSEGFGVFIDSGTGGTGNGGDVTIRVNNGNFNQPFINTGDSFFFGTGSAGNLYIGGHSGMADSLIFGTAGNLSTEAFSAKAGSITLEAHNMSMNGIFVSTISLLGQNPITINADQLSMENVVRVQAQTIGPGNGGNIVFTGKRLQMSNESAFITSTFGDGNAGNILINASEYVRIADGNNPPATTPSGLFSNSLGIEGVVTHGNAGAIQVVTPRLEMTGGGRISTTTQTAGRGGDVTITASEGVFISGQRLSDIPLEDFGLGGSNGSGIFARTIGTIQCGGTCGNGGNQVITTGQLVLQNGGILDSGTTGNGHGGNIQVNASTITMSGTLMDGTPGGVFSRTIGNTTDAGAGGTISLNTGQSVAISNGAAVSANSTGPGPTGNINITAGNQFTMTSSSVTTDADQSSGGAIKITTNPNGTVDLVNSTISASVLDGTGGGGSVNIDPQSVVLQNSSHISADAIFGPGGNIFITTNLLLPDATSTITASSQFGQQGTVIIQSPVAPASGKIVPLGQKPLIPTSLLGQRCAALAGGSISSFTVAGRETLPAEPGSWLSSPLALTTPSDGNVQQANNEPEAPLLSLRQIGPSGFLTRSFAVESSGCSS